MQILGALSMGLLIHYSNDHLSLSFVPISVTIVLTLCSLIFLVSSTINWKTSGKIRMARINFVSVWKPEQALNNKKILVQGHMRKQHAHIVTIYVSRRRSYVNFTAAYVCVCVYARTYLYMSTSSIPQIVHHKS